jgi:hypothetical protein
MFLMAFILTFDTRIDHCVLPFLGISRDTATFLFVQGIKILPVPTPKLYDKKVKFFLSPKGCQKGAIK